MIKLPFILIGDHRQLKMQDTEARTALVNIVTLLCDQTLSPLGSQIRDIALQGLK